MKNDPKPIMLPSIVASHLIVVHNRWERRLKAESEVKGKEQTVESGRLTSLRAEHGLHSNKTGCNTNTLTLPLAIKLKKN